MEQYISVNRILSKLARELNTEEFDETDIIEWIGEALGFLQVAELHEEAVAFKVVKNYECTLPQNIHYIIQVALQRDTKNKTNLHIPYSEIYEEEIPQKNKCNCDKPIQPKYNYTVVHGFEALVSSPIYQSGFQPVRLADHSFFNSFVCKEKNYNEIYCPNCGNEEYTVVGKEQPKLRFSFKDGIVAIAYLRNRLDEETGYPLIPDNSYYITAITYYVKWKLSEIKSWNGDRNHMSICGDMERKWTQYARKAKNYIKMPKSVDDYQDLMEQSIYLIPNQRKYYNYFGNLNKKQELIYG